MKKKIIHITLGKANPNRQNGVNKVVNSLLHYQVENNFNAEFWGISFNQERNFPSRNYKTTLFKDSRVKFKLDRKLKNAIKALNSNETIVHLHGVFSPQLFQVGKMLKKHNIPYFFTPHGGYNLKALEKSKWIKRLYIALFEKKLVDNACGIQLLGDSEKEGFRKYFDNETYIIPNGQEAHFTIPKNANFAATKIGFLGRIDIETKGLDLLLKGLKEINKTKKVTLEIVGDGGEIDQLRKVVAEYNLTSNVCFKGAVFGLDKFDLIASWDAMCLVSRNEGLPGAVLEAASVGVPSIISKATNLEKYITTYNAGWVLDEYTTTALVDCLETMLSKKENQQLEQYQLGAKKMIHNAFDWNHIVHSLVNAYAQ